MILKNLTLKNLDRDSQKFTLSNPEWHEHIYTVMLEYFQEPETFERKHLIIAGNFVYGLMPTMMNMNLENADSVVKILNKAKESEILTKDELLTIKGCLNNSLVGTSKILHFINPKVYAIWDSRIFRYLTEKKTTYGIDKVETYLSYLDGVHSISNETEYSELHRRIAKLFAYPIAPTRVMELIMFQTDKKKNTLYRPKKKPQN